MLICYNVFWGNFAYHCVLTCMSIFSIFIFLFLCFFFSVVRSAHGVTQLFVQNKIYDVLCLVVNVIENSHTHLSLV